MATTRPLTPAAVAARDRYIDLGGQVLHVFRFGAPVDLAFEYFLDVPAVFRLLPDALDVFPYGPNRYRLIVGADDGHGHAMAAIFDLQAELDHNRAIRVFPAFDGPAVETDAAIFAGSLAAEAVFFDEGERSCVEYAVNIEMSIPIPRVLNMMPHKLLQSIGEKAMEFKMSRMINGFTRGITDDFHTWAAGVS